jgi:AraC-like DNA-binding protein
MAVTPLRIDARSKRARTKPAYTVLTVRLQGILVFAARYGIAPALLCQHAGVPVAELGDRDRRVSSEWQAALTRALTRLLPDVELGIEAGLFWSLDRSGYVGELVHHSSTLLEALSKGLRASQLLGSENRDEQAELHLDDDTASVVIPACDREFATEDIETLMFTMVGQLRAFDTAPVVPRSVCFTFDKTQLRERYESYFGCPVQFSREENVIVFDRAQLERPVRGAQGEGTAGPTSHFERALEQLSAAEFVARVEQVIAQQLERGVISGDDTARALGLSLRSLQRKLETFGTHYRALADIARRDAAYRLLGRPETTIYEAAFALGYRDTGSFVQAFRRWTGLMPNEYRASRVVLA